MKPLLVAAILILAVALYGSTATAQEAPLDLGESNLLTLACADAHGQAGPGITVRNCRRAAPEEITGNFAVVTVRVATNVGPFLLKFHYTRSLWAMRKLDVVQG